MTSANKNRPNPEAGKLNQGQAQTLDTVMITQNGHNSTSNSSEIQKAQIAFIKQLAGEGAQFTICDKGKKYPTEANWPNNRHGLEEALKALKAGHPVGINHNLSPRLAVIDVDENFRGFKRQFPQLAGTVTIVRDNNPDRAKLVYLAERDLPKGQKWQGAINDTEYFYKTGQTVTAGAHPTGAQYQPVNLGNGFKTLSREDLDTIATEWAGKEAPKTPQQPAGESWKHTIKPVTERERAYAKAALKKAAEMVAGTPEGNRNNTLNAQTFAVAGFIPTGLLEEDEVQTAMVKAGLASGLTYNKVIGTVNSGLQSGKEEPRQAPKEVNKPTVKVTKSFDFIDRTVEALAEANTPKEIFIQSGKLVKVIPDENGIYGIHRLNPYALKGELGKRVRFVRTLTDGEEKTTSPPIDAVRAVEGQGHYPGMPSLQGIVTAPIVAPDGTIEDKTGYLPKTKVFRPQDDLEIGDTTPTKERLDWAKSLILEDLLVDFPFKGDADRANAVALLLLPFVRHYIDGPTPLHLIESSQPGSGKGLLAHATAYPFLGKAPELATAPNNEAEWGKQITSSLLTGPSHVFFDNVENLDSGKLASATTSRYWNSRLLGGNEQISLPVNCVFGATGNNVTTSIEINRRICLIRLIPRVEHPALRRREEFKHFPLTTWVAENRSQLVTAILTIIRAWLEAGEPENHDLTIGSYEEWAAKLGGILEVAGIEGFMGNYEDNLKTGNPERDAWVALFNAWFDKHGDNPVGTGEIFPLASYKDGFGDDGKNILGAYLGTGNERSRKTKLGSELANKKDSVFGGFMLVNTGSDRSGAAQYRLMKLR